MPQPQPAWDKPHKQAGTCRAAVAVRVCRPSQLTKLLHERLAMRRSQTESADVRMRLVAHRHDGSGMELCSRAGR